MKKQTRIARTPKTLTADSLKQVNGGEEIKQDVTVNKAKTADKAFQKMNEYIRG